MQENIKNGQKIKSFEVQALLNNQGETIDIVDGHGDNAGYPSFSSLTDHGTPIVKQDFSTIGYKRILKFDTPITTNKIRVVILDAKDKPQISNIEVY